MCYLLFSLLFSPTVGVPITAAMTNSPVAITPIWINLTKHHKLSKNGLTTQQVISTGNHKREVIGTVQVLLLWVKKLQSADLKVINTNLAQKGEIKTHFGAHARTNKWQLPTVFLLQNQWLQLSFYAWMIKPDAPTAHRVMIKASVHWYTDENSQVWENSPIPVA